MSDQDELNVEAQLDASMEIQRLERELAAANKRIAELEKKVEGMKCCGNCGTEYIDIAGNNMCELYGLCDGSDKWKAKEISDAK